MSPDGQLPFASLPDPADSSLSNSMYLAHTLPPSQHPARRLVREGADTLSVADLLAVLLGEPAAIELAHAILARFGVEGLCQATPEELQQLPGIGPARAARLSAAIALGRAVLAHQEEERIIRSPADAADFLIPLLAKREAEQFIVVLLNTKNRVIGVVPLYQGSLNSSVVRVGEVFREAIRRQAAAIMIAHNHPSGALSPSPEDIQVTRDIRHAGALLDIDLVDHLLVSDRGYLSLREKGLGF